MSKLWLSDMYKKIILRYGQFVRWLLRPAMAPLFKEMVTDIERLRKAAVTKNDISVTKQGTVRWKGKK